MTGQLPAAGPRFAYSKQIDEKSNLNSI